MGVNMVYEQDIYQAQQEKINFYFYMNWTKTLKGTNDIHNFIYRAKLIPKVI